MLLSLRFNSQTYKYMYKRVIVFVYLYYQSLSSLFSWISELLFAQGLDIIDKWVVHFVIVY